jgi:hypothetical protein
VSRPRTNGLEAPHKRPPAKPGQTIPGPQRAADAPPIRHRLPRLGGQGRAAAGQPPGSRRAAAGRPPGHRRDVLGWWPVRARRAGERSGRGGATRLPATHGVRSMGELGRVELAAGRLRGACGPDCGRPFASARGELWAASKRDPPRLTLLSLGRQWPMRPRPASTSPRPIECPSCAGRIEGEVTRRVRGLPPWPSHPSPALPGCACHPGVVRAGGGRRRRVVMSGGRLGAPTARGRLLRHQRRTGC